MITALQTKEIVLEVRNEIGVLHQISKIVADKGVNMTAVTVDLVGKNAVIRLLTDDNLRAKEALEENRYKPVEVKAVTVELSNKPGLLAAVTDRLARAGVNIRHLAATALPNQKTCQLLLTTSDDQRAVVILNEED